LGLAYAKNKVTGRLHLQSFSNLPKNGISFQPANSWFHRTNQLFSLFYQTKNGNCHENANNFLRLWPKGRRPQDGGASKVQDIGISDASKQNVNSRFQIADARLQTVFQKMVQHFNTEIY